MPPKNEYSLGAALLEEGLQFVRMGADSNPVVKDMETDKEFSYDLDADLNQLGVDRDNTKVIFNTPDNAQAVSPLSFADRGKLSVANSKGAIGFLQNKFDKVIPHEELGPIVLDNGVWKQVDPSFLGNGTPLEKAEELGKDLADLGDVAINIASTELGRRGGGAIGQAAGVAGGPAAQLVTSTAGSLLGAGVGGALSGKVRTSLGRYFGTYEATPEEELKDIGMESIFSLGGQGIAAGAQPLFSALVTAGKKLGSSAIKESAVALYGILTGVGRPAMRTLIENGDKVAFSMKNAVKVGKGSADAAINTAKDAAIQNADELLTTAVKELPGQYKQILNNVVSKADKAKMVVNMPSVIDDAVKGIPESGLGNVITKKGKLVFEPFNDLESIARIRQGLSAPKLDAASSREIRFIVDELNRFKGAGTVRGDQAANVLTGFNKRLNQLTNKTFRGQRASSDYMAALAAASKHAKQSIGDQFGKVGLGAEYAQLSSLYQKFSNSVNFAKKVLRDKSGPETLVNRLVSEAGRNRTIGGIANSLVELTGKKGAQLFDNIITNDAASKFLPWMPKIGLTQAGVLGGGSASIISGSIRAAAVPLAGQFSPRIVAAQTRMMQAAARHLGFIKNLGPKQLEQFINSPTLFNSLTRTTINELQQEGQDTQNLLNLSGATSNEGQ